MRVILLLVALFSGGLGLKFNNYFENGMVLQRDVPNKLWGYGTLSDEQVAVSCLEKDGATKSYKLYTPKQVREDVWEVVTDPQGAWSKCFIEMLGASLVLDDVLYGDVWICSGQSNMEMMMWAVFNSTEEIAYSEMYEDSIRYTTVELQTNPETNNNFDQVMKYPWAPASDSKALGTMSAVCFLTARAMFDEVQVPMGLIASSWGGTPVESWTAKKTLDSCGVPDHTDVDYPQWTNSNLWNGMINPLKRASVKGFLWYQGESNAGYNRDLYSCTFPAMINDWRTEFQENSFTAPLAPFGFVQIAMFRPETLDNGYPVIRWHQTMDVGFVPHGLMPNVFMSTPLDTYDPKEGYPGNIHPRNKQLASVRLAYAGLNVAYGMTDFPTKGPFPTYLPILGQDGTVTVIYDMDIDYNVNAEVSGFYWCGLADPVACDAGGSAEMWSEIPKEAVTQIDARTLEISSKQTGSLAYLWRETPVVETLGLPIYSADGFRMPSAPWKYSLEP